jgi:hypothetical protein
VDSIPHPPKYGKRKGGLLITSPILQMLCWSKYNGKQSCIPEVPNLGGRVPLGARERSHISDVLGTFVPVGGRN